MTIHDQKTRARFTRHRPFVVAMMCLGCLLSTASMLFAADAKITGRLVVEDVLARPNTPAMLLARLVQDGPAGVTGLGGETIEFVVQGQRAGTALTDKDGHASLEFKTHMRGNHKIVANVETSSKVTASSGIGNFASWERRKPILFVDVVTLLKSEDGTMLSSFNTSTPGEPDADAPHELTMLGEFYFNIIYLLRGNDGDVEHLRDWLKSSKFPPGITRKVQVGSEGLLAFIALLKEGGWDHVEAGVGQSKGFADTLVKNRIKAVIFPDPSKNEKFPRRAKIVSKWKDVRKHL